MGEYATYINLRIDGGKTTLRLCILIWKSARKFHNQLANSRCNIEHLTIIILNPNLAKFRFVITYFSVAQLFQFVHRGWQ